MKQLIGLFFLFSFMGVQAQDGSFIMKLNGKQVVQGPISMRTLIKPTPITQKQLQPGGKLQVTVTGAANNTGWKRILIMADEQGNEIKTMEKNMVNGTYDWNITGLKDILKKYKKVAVHTYTIPVDEQQAALVRVMRFQLCTLELK